MKESFDTQAEQRRAVADQAERRFTEIMGGPTPLYSTGEYLGLDKNRGNRLYIKDETDNPTGAFKLRGAFVAVAEAYRAGAASVVTASAGNHGQGIALAAHLHGMEAAIFVPETTPRCKLEGLQRFDDGRDRQRVFITGRTFDEAERHARAYRENHSGVFVHPFDDPAVIRGQGEVGRELAAQLTARGCAPEDVVVCVPVGGGGLLAGVAEQLKAFSDKVTVVGVQIEGSDSAYKSFRSDMVHKATKPNRLVDGLRVKRAGIGCMQRINKYVDDMLVVDAAALGREYERLLGQNDDTALLPGYEAQTVPEPAGLLAVAGAREYFSRHPELRDKHVVTLQTGRNLREEDVDALLAAAAEHRHRHSRQQLGVRACNGLFTVRPRPLKALPR